MVVFAGAGVAPLLSAGQATMLTLIAIVVFFLYLDYRAAKRARRQEEAVAARQAAAGQPVTQPKSHRTILGGVFAVLGWFWLAAFGPPAGQEPDYPPEHDPDDLDFGQDDDGPSDN